MSSSMQDRLLSAVPPARPAVSPPAWDSPLQRLERASSAAQVVRDAKAAELARLDNHLAELDAELAKETNGGSFSLKNVHARLSERRDEQAREVREFDELSGSLNQLRQELADVRKQSELAVSKADETLREHMSLSKEENRLLMKELQTERTRAESAEQRASTARNEADKAVEKATAVERERDNQLRQVKQDRDDQLKVARAERDDQARLLGAERTKLAETSRALKAAEQAREDTIARATRSEHELRARVTQLETDLKARDVNVTHLERLVDMLGGTGQSKRPERAEKTGDKPGLPANVVVRFPSGADAATTLTPPPPRAPTIKTPALQAVPSEGTPGPARAPSLKVPALQPAPVGGPPERREKTGGPMRPPGPRPAPPPGSGTPGPAERPPPIQNQWASTVAISSDALDAMLREDPKPTSAKPTPAPVPPPAPPGAWPATVAMTDDLLTELVRETAPAGPPALKAVPDPSRIDPLVTINITDDLLNELADEVSRDDLKK